MTEHSEALVDLIDVQLVAAQEEIAALERARASLLDSSRKTEHRSTPRVRAPKAAPRAAAPRAKAAKRLPPNSNVARAYAFLLDHPGTEAAALGPALGLSPLAGYRLVNQLQEMGAAEKRARAWFPKMTVNGGALTLSRP